MELSGPNDIVQMLQAEDLFQHGHDQLWHVYWHNILAPLLTGVNFNPWMKYHIHYKVWDKNDLPIP